VPVRWFISAADAMESSGESRGPHGACAQGATSDHARAGLAPSTGALERREELHAKCTASIPKMHSGD
jgi:hypothetical protein